MKLRILFLAAILAHTAGAVDYPVSAGMVNDFTSTIPDAVQQALELRLRAYERATSNEIAIAIVPSLQGQTLEEFSQGLYRAWGLGKPDKDNGVLFLWARDAGQVRIQPGYGLESALTQDVCSAIADRASELFQKGNSAQGVQAAVDRIIQHLDAAAPASQPSAPSGDRDLSGVPAIAAVAVLVLLFGIMIYHTARTHELQHRVPAGIARGEASLKAAFADASEVRADFEVLRTDAPREVWDAYTTPLAELPGELEILRQQWSGIASQRREDYGELTRARRALRRWEHSLAAKTAVLEDFRKRMHQFCEARDRALESIPRLEGVLASLTAGMEEAGEDRQRALLLAAQQTLDRVRLLQAHPPVNWLEVCDLLEDIQGCADRLELLLQSEADPEAVRTSVLAPRPPRYWPGSDKESPAAKGLADLANAWHGNGKDEVD